jgi:hypothetical protein
MSTDKPAKDSKDAKFSFLNTSKTNPFATPPNTGPKSGSQFHQNLSPRKNATKPIARRAQGK